MDKNLIKQEAKAALVGKRLMLLVVILVASAISGGLTLIGIGIILTPLLVMGLFLVTKDVLRNKEIDVNRFVEPFKDLNHALKVIVVFILLALLVSVGLLLLIVPGVILALMYGQAVFIVAENKDIDILDAFKKSKELMAGKKMDLFVLLLSFIGHYLLGIITFGIYFLYFVPYLQTVLVNYYLHLTNQRSNTRTNEEVKEAEYQEK